MKGTVRLPPKTAIAIGCGEVNIGGAIWGKPLREFRWSLVLARSRSVAPPRGSTDEKNYVANAMEIRPSDVARLKLVVPPLGSLHKKECAIASEKVTVAAGRGAVKFGGGTDGKLI